MVRRTQNNHLLLVQIKAILENILTHVISNRDGSNCLLSKCLSWHHKLLRPTILLLSTEEQLWSPVDQDLPYELKWNTRCKPATILLQNWIHPQHCLCLFKKKKKKTHIFYFLHKICTLTLPLKCCLQQVETVVHWFIHKIWSFQETQRLTSQNEMICPRKLHKSVLFPALTVYCLLYQCQISNKYS